MSAEIKNSFAHFVFHHSKKNFLITDYKKVGSVGSGFCTFVFCSLLSSSLSFFLSLCQYNNNTKIQIHLEIKVSPKCTRHQKEIFMVQATEANKLLTNLSKYTSATRAKLKLPPVNSFRLETFSISHHHKSLCDYVCACTCVFFKMRRVARVELKKEGLEQFLRLRECLMKVMCLCVTPPVISMEEGQYILGLKQPFDTADLSLRAMVEERKRKSRVLDLYIFTRLEALTVTNVEIRRFHSIGRLRKSLKCLIMENGIRELFHLLEPHNEFPFSFFIFHFIDKRVDSHSSLDNESEYGGDGSEYFDDKSLTNGRGEYERSVDLSLLKKGPSLDKDDRVAPLRTYSSLSSISVSDWPQLTYLRASNCKINFMHKCLKRLIQLKHLNLSFNSIREICNLEECFQLTDIDLSCNEIRYVRNIHLVIGNVCHLNLQQNRIDDIGDLWRLFGLQTLDLRYNIISKLQNIQPLRKLPNLECLRLNENPICVEENYRFKCLFELRDIFIQDDLRDFQLDDQMVTPVEREQIKTKMAELPTPSVKERASSSIVSHHTLGPLAGAKYSDDFVAHPTIGHDDITFADVRSSKGKLTMESTARFEPDENDNNNNNDNDNDNNNDNENGNEKEQERDQDKDSQYLSDDSFPGVENIRPKKKKSKQGRALQASRLEAQRGLCKDCRNTDEPIEGGMGKVAARIPKEI
ncbi:nischarin [Reticulomyxa filosa]|uniref:Nischarin n=1 Tax=Reticulomyxa filosa TaxID=46433 RepID=X6LVJ9_RETFI|nr:nischarin [Reticulomyxa filosa]|eukprot:ETO04755.1 nischarin [Reticulomyxa filosa]